MDEIGAKVRVECKDKNSMEVHFSKEATTDVTGTYQMLINEDHGDHLCDAMLVSSPRPDCARFSSGRERSRVILTSNNGIASNARFVNAMGFEADEPMSGCTQLLKQYLEYNE